MAVLVYGATLAHNSFGGPQFKFRVRPKIFPIIFAYF